MSEPIGKAMSQRVSENETEEAVKLPLPGTRFTRIGENAFVQEADGAWEFNGEQMEEKE